MRTRENPEHQPQQLLTTIPFACLSSYDTEGKGQLTHQEFLQKLGINYSADVHRPYAEDYFNFMGHFTKPQQGRAEVVELPQSAGKEASAR